MTNTNAPTRTRPAGPSAAESTAPRATPASPPRLLLLDALRFTAAITVVLYHFTATPTVAGYWDADPEAAFQHVNQVSRYGWLAVPAFFILSGFVILLTARGRTLAQYVGSRAGRLLPAYWAAVALTVLLQSVWSGGRRTSLTDSLLNLTMAPDLFGAEPVQVVFWTLLVELKLYLLVGLLVALGGVTPRRALTLALTWPLVAEVAARLGWHPVADALVAHYAPFFGIGIVLYLLRYDGVSPARLAALAVTLTLGVDHVLSRAQHAAQLQGVAMSAAVSVVVLLACTATVWWASGPRAQVRSPRLARALTWGSAVTYPLYLLHSQFGYAIIGSLADRLPAWLTLGITLITCTVLAHLVHLTVERPTARPLRRAVERGLTRNPGLPRENKELPREVVPPVREVVLSGGQRGRASDSSSTGMPSRTG